MTERSTPQPRPLSVLLAPRSMRTVLLVMLLPFLILPLLFGYIGYGNVRGSALQSAKDALSSRASTITDRLQNVRDAGIQQLNQVAQDAGVVRAAMNYRSTTSVANLDNLFQAISVFKTQDAHYDNMFLVDTRNNAILASSNPAWSGKAFPALNGGWAFPLYVSEFNQIPFGSDTAYWMIGSLIESATDHSV